MSRALILSPALLAVGLVIRTSFINRLAHDSPDRLQGTKQPGGRLFSDVREACRQMDWSKLAQPAPGNPHPPVIGCGLVLPFSVLQ